ncbi:MAG TPA: PAS domain-containing protein [Chitinophagaceae bacterium]|nr:PAS domain-containing protein [Chitinophagaceae bacterium]
MDELTFTQEGLVSPSTVLLQSLIDALPGGIELLKAVRKDDRIVDFEYVLLNKVATKYIAGKQPGKRVVEHENNKTLFEHLAEVMQSGNSSSSNTERTLAGSLHAFIEKYARFTDGVIIYSEDTTSRIQSDLRRAEDNHFVLQVAELSPDIIYIMDLNTLQVLYSNRSVAAYLGYKKQEIAAMKNPVFGLMHEEDIPRMREHIEMIKNITHDNKVVEIEYRMKRAKGGYSWFCDRNAVFKRNKSRTPVEKIGISQDITDRKEKEAQKKTDVDIINQAEEIAALGAWEYDLLTEEFKWTDGMYRLFNLPKDEPIAPGIYFDYSVPEESDRVNKLIDHIVYGDGPFEETISLLPPEQEKKIVRIKAVVQKDKMDRPVKVIGVDMDITGEVKAMLEIQQLNKTLIAKNEELRELNSEIKLLDEVVVHDYRDTLKQLYVHMEYIVAHEAGKLSDSGKANIRRAQTGIQKMNLLTDDINSYFQLYDMDMETSPVDTAAIVREVLATFHGKLQQSNASVEYHDLPELPANALLLTRLLSNLLSNSIKFRNLLVPLKIKINYSHAEELNSIKNAKKNIPYGIISVTDNGLGFDQSEAEKIFGLFYRCSSKDKKVRGSGIGLAICRRIMKMHDGFITAEGQLAMGATFNCYFPLR